MLWLLEPDTLRRLQNAQQHFGDPAAALRWETEQAAAEVAQASRDGLPQLLTMNGSTATIQVEGTLTKRPDFWAKFFGGNNTTYSSIRSALAFAAQSADIGEIVFSIDSPGGSADGLIELLDSIAQVRQSSGKKMRVLADQAQSAAYGIAAAVGNIEARHRGATFGSIGTAASYWVSPNVVELTNTDSPDKRPNLNTPEGKAVVVRYLDQINHEFASAIAQGRGVPLQRVTEGYGRGASMTAAEARRLGLIDSIATSAPRAVPNNQSSKGNNMGAENQDDRAALEQAAIQRGITQERDRVLGHLTCGEGCGDMSIALEANRGGHEMNAQYTARYLTAGMNRAAQGQRQTESKTTETKLAAVGATTPATASTQDFGDQVAAELQANRSGNGFVRA